MLNIGFVGTGKMAQIHMHNINSLKYTKVSAIWSRSRERAEEASKKFGGEVYTELEEMLEKATLDALYICLIPSEHGNPEFLAIEKGIPFFVEKPVAISVNVGKKILDLVEKNNLITSVGYQWRYLDLVEKAKRILTGKKIVMVQGYWLSRFPISSWWNNRALSGGQIIEQGSHIYDLCRYFFGEPEEVYGFWIPPESKSGIEKSSSVNIKFSSGIIANISCSCVLPTRYRAGLHILTEEVIIELVSEKSGMENTILNVLWKDRREKVTTEVDTYLVEDKVFLDAVKTQDQSGIKSKYEDALATLQITIDAYKSIIEEHPIRYAKKGGIEK